MSANLPQNVHIPLGGYRVGRPNLGSMKTRGLPYAATWSIADHKPVIFLFRLKRTG
jgi:hypothetical protein